MEHNPYAPPQAKTEITFLREAAPRPVAIWLLMACLLVFVLIFVIGTVQFVGTVLAHWGEIRSFGFLAVSLVWRLAIMAVFFTATYGLYCRSTWSRWLGIALVALLAAFSIFGPDSTNYSNDAQRAGGQFGRQVLLPLLFCWWAYALAFSSKAKRYFSKPSSDAA